MSEVGIGCHMETPKEQCKEGRESLAIQGQKNNHPLVWKDTRRTTASFESYPREKDKGELLS